MFTGINVSDYKLGWDLPKALFLRDCLKGEFRFEKSLGGNPEIYKINSDGTERETYWEEVVYFVQSVVPGSLREQEKKLTDKLEDAKTKAPVYIQEAIASERALAEVSDRFFGCFHDSDAVEKAIKNLGICLRFEG